LASSPRSATDEGSLILRFLGRRLIPANALRMTPLDSGRLAMAKIVKLNYRPKSKLEKFGQKIFNLLVENFPQTFYVGGMVRDLLLRKKIRDIDIATSADPEQVIAMLKKHGISADPKYKKLGIVAIPFGSVNLSVTTFRMDYYINSRYPKVTFIANIKQDAQRRDFTINALYLSPKSGTLIDFHNGVGDLKRRQLRLIGDPKKRLAEDPLRIVRALRFAKTLDLKLELGTKKTIENNFSLLNFLTKSRIESELKKIKSLRQRKFVAAEVRRQILLDIK